MPRIEQDQKTMIIEIELILDTEAVDVAEQNVNFIRKGNYNGFKYMGGD